MAKSAGAVGLAATCKRDGTKYADPSSVVSGCEGGEGYVCADQGAWADRNDPNLSYGFVARLDKNGRTPCGKCYEWVFDGDSIDKEVKNGIRNIRPGVNNHIKGKRMIVQTVNSGGAGEFSDQHFDLMMGGGGAGRNDACNRQFGKRDWGAIWGGFGPNDRAKCATLPQEQQASCYWRYDWAGGWDNPSVTYRQVICPKVLTDKSGIVNNDGATVVAPTPTSVSSGALALPPCVRGNVIATTGCVIHRAAVGDRPFLANRDASVNLFHDQLVIRHPAWNNSRLRVSGTFVRPGVAVDRLEFNANGRLILWGRTNVGWGGSSSSVKLWESEREGGPGSYVALDWARSTGFYNNRVNYPALVIRNRSGATVYMTIPTDTALRYYI
jgi:hypothetical protein